MKKSAGISGAFLSLNKGVAYSALIMALWTAFQPAAFKPQLFVEFLFP